MTDEKVSAIRARLKFPTQEDFAQGYARYISAGGIFIPMSASRLKQRGERVRFQFTLANGENALLGEGVVHQVHRSTTGGTPVGILVKFTRLSQSSKKLVDQIVAEKAALKEDQAAELPITQEEAPSPREDNDTPHSQVAIDRIAELYAAEEGGLEEDTRVGPDFNDVTPTRAIEKQEEARVKRAHEASRRETTEERAIDRTQLHTQSEVNEQAEAQASDAGEDVLDAEGDDHSERETSPEERSQELVERAGVGADEPPEEDFDQVAAQEQVIAEDEGFEPEAEDKSSAAPAAQEAVVFLPMDEEGVPDVPAADDAPTSLDLIEESLPEEVEVVPAPAVALPPSLKAVLPPPPLFSSQPSAPSGLQRLSEASIEASEFESADFVMDPDELDDFFPSSGGSHSLFTSSPSQQISLPKVPSSPPRSPEGAEDSASAAGPLKAPAQEPVASRSPTKLGSTAGGLQVLAYDDASKFTDLEAISLGEEEGDIDLLFDGIFSGNQAEDEDYFGDVFTTPSSDSQEVDHQRMEAPSDELISLLDSIDEVSESSIQVPSGSSTPSIQLQHALGSPGMDPNLHFNLPEKSAVSEVDVLGDLLGEEASIVPEETRHLLPPLVPKKKKGLLSKLFGKDE